MTKKASLDPTVHKFKSGRLAKVRPPRHFTRPIERDVKKIAAALRAKFNKGGHLSET